MNDDLGGAAAALVNEADRPALQSKVAIRRSVDDTGTDRVEPLFLPERGAWVGYEETQTGTFLNAENIRLRWVSPDFFEYLPVGESEFGFVRANGETITPGRMYTDGGSIPRAFRNIEGFSPWNFAPAFLVHDWEFDVHHCRISDKSFSEVSVTMMEGIKTLMEQGVSKRSQSTFYSIQLAILSPFGEAAWNRNPEVCPLPDVG
ncbi:DUF1353 domain-containing protein [Roseitranquillus sediminis]|uniref:DUF1353 domain-containing protein n=1 Tax=Roseitranquillus sediminis TaxID=2809051 RepID=UPI001D0CD8C2|nr:DUF1353 domain-containing protein [Roseitranquillus sediminis]MBM9593436.1 hypothetical protein [Roseitranquillus sediminis]